MMGNAAEGMVFNIMRFSVSDGPGIRTTVFLKGCPLHCVWCHNPESIDRGPEILIRQERCIRCGSCAEDCEEHAIVRVGDRYETDRDLCVACGGCIDACAADAREMIGRKMRTDEVMEDVLRDRLFYERSGGGVTFSGGEPLLQHEFLHELLTTCKQEGLHTAVDTTGFTTPAILEKIAALTDLFLYDLKSVDDDIHTRFTGVSNEIILANLRRLAEWNASVIVRIPIVPGVNDDAGSIANAGAFVASLKTVKELHLLPYHRTGVAKLDRLGKKNGGPDFLPPDWEHLNELVELLREHVETVCVGG